MARITLTMALRQEYETLFTTCNIRPERAQEVERIVRAILNTRARYTQVFGTIGVPWFFIAAVHNMEANLNFMCHLHNGDPLTARTIHVPAGRPKAGQPPFTWESSAADALLLQGLGSEIDWTLAGTLYQLERYNGWGYRARHPEVLSPYLWSFSQYYSSGKYVADGTWSDTATSKQCGAAVILRRLSERGEIEFTDQPAPTPEAQPLVVSFSMTRSVDPAVVARAEALQQWLNTFPGIFVKVDGIPGQRTSDAYQKVTGSYLPGDVRSG
jgi:lysozyme family protein